MEEKEEALRMEIEMKYQFELLKYFAMKNFESVCYNQLQVCMAINTVFALSRNNLWALDWDTINSNKGRK